MTQSYGGCGGRNTASSLVNTWARSGYSGSTRNKSVGTGRDVACVFWVVAAE